MSEEASSPEMDSVYTQHGDVKMKRRGERVFPDFRFEDNPAMSRSPGEIGYTLGAVPKGEGVGTGLPAVTEVSPVVGPVVGKTHPPGYAGATAVTTASEPRRTAVANSRPRISRRMKKSIVTPSPGRCRPTRRSMLAARSRLRERPRPELRLRRGCRWATPGVARLFLRCLRPGCRRCV